MRSHRLVLATLSIVAIGCGPGAGADTVPDPRFDQIEAAVTTLEGSWTSDGRSSALESVFTQLCSDGERLPGFVDGSFVEVRHDTEPVGFRQSVARFADDDTAADYVDRWRDDPLGCMDTVTTFRPLAIERADEVVRLDVAFADSTAFAQQLAVARHGPIVVLVGVSVERPTDLDVDAIIGHVAAPA